MSTLFTILLIVILLYFLKKEISSNLTEQSFLSIVNHTFRTPLTRIKWMSDSLQQNMSQEERLGVVQNISNSVNRVLEIVDIIAGVKDINSRTSYDFRAVSIREIIEEAIAKYRAPLNEKKISLELPTSSSMPLLTVDTKKITFVIHAILENAIWYSKENGSIKIKSEVKNRMLILKIIDDGLGLSWRDKYNLFKRFYRGNRAVKMNTDGMGLGLYMAREIIRRHHGSIRAVSKGKDKGSTFSIHLPLDRR
jgi:two-component system CheB/CheR fusion protein